MKYKNYAVLYGKILWISSATEIVDKRKRSTAICRYLLQIPRPNRKEYDYVICTAFGNRAWYAMQHMRTVMWLTVVGHIHSDYTTLEGAVSLAVHYQKIRAGSINGERRNTKHYEKMETET